MIKFRSMKDAVDQEGNILPDEERITPLVKSYVLLHSMKCLS